MGIRKSIKRGFSFLGNALDDSVSFLKKGWKRFFLHLFVAAIVMIAGAAIGGILGINVMQVLRDSSALAGNISGIIIILLFCIVGVAYGGAAALGGVDYAYHGKKVGFFNSKNVGVAFKWAIFIMGVYLLCILFIFGSAYLLAGVAGGEDTESSMQLFRMLINLIILPIALIVGFFMQYVYPELAVNKRGPFDAVCSSYRLVKANAWESLTLLILSYLISGVSGIVFYIGVIGVMMLGLAAIAISPLFLILVVLALLATFAVYILLMEVMLTLIVKFYAQVVGSKQKYVRKSGGR